MAMKPLGPGGLGILLASLLITSLSYGQVRESRPPRSRQTLDELDQLVKREVLLLFQAYERRNSSGFGVYLSSSFRARDALGLGHDQLRMVQSVSGDFRNLRDLDFNITVGVPQYSADRRTGRVDIVWQRRARFSSTGEEWIVRNQRTVLVLGTRAGKLRLSGIEGKALFGLTSAAGVLLVTEGTIDGRPVTAPTTVLNGRLGAGVQDIATFGNIRRVDRPTADLAILAGDVVVVPRNPTFDAAPIGTFVVNVTVRNQGTIATGPFVTTVANNFGQPEVSRSEPGLAAQAAVTRQFRLTTPAPADNHSVTAGADSRQQVFESSESNNSRTVVFRTLPGKL